MFGGVEIVKRRSHYLDEYLGGGHLALWFPLQRYESQGLVVHPLPNFGLKQILPYFNRINNISVKENYVTLTLMSILIDVTVHFPEDVKFEFYFCIGGFE